MNEGEIEPGEVKGPASLPTIQVLRCLEVCEVPVVIQDLYGVLFPFQDFSPLL